jgi:hypothetical protein
LPTQIFSLKKKQITKISVGGGFMVLLGVDNGCKYNEDEAVASANPSGITNPLSLKSSYDESQDKSHIMHRIGDG